MININMIDKNETNVKLNVWVLLAVSTALFLITLIIWGPIKYGNLRVTFFGNKSEDYVGTENVERIESCQIPIQKGHDPSVEKILKTTAGPIIRIASETSPLPSVMYKKSLHNAVIDGSNGPSEVSPNSIGLYPPTLILAEHPIKITLRTTPGEIVSIQAVDGGYLDEKVRDLEIMSDISGDVSFQFTSLKAIGVYRVAINLSDKQLFLSLLVQ